ncbi:T9SS type A sorting domain-containing protein [Flavobacterium myungsuense]|uniref:T9SS type A sorting domain-containing protein n=1 Tax=Flavobacterium myungsuense TaxID=651823 RepID=UPI003624F532
MKNFTQAFYTTKSKSIKWVFAILTLLLLSAETTFAQATGDFRSLVATGNWGINTSWERYNGSAWVAATSGVYPGVTGETGNVTILNGHTITINVTPAVASASLTVGGGTSGILQFETTTARTLTITGSVTIASGGIFRSAATGTVITHNLSVGTNLTNNGTLDFSTNTNTAAAVITFNGAANNTFSGTGGTTDIWSITMNKGTGTVTNSSPVLDISTSAFSVSGSTADVSGLLVSATGNGIIKFSGTNTWSTTLFTVAVYTIPTTLGVWLNNPNMTVTGAAGSPVLNGLLRVTAGTYNVGTTNNSMTYGPGSIFTMEGGAMNVAARFANASAANSITFTMSSGTFTTAMGSAAQPNASGSVASFDIPATGLTSSFTMSGGTIVFAKAASTVDVRMSAPVVSISGGTFQFGNAATVSGTGAAFKIGVAAGTTSRLSNVTVNATSTPTVTCNTPVFINGNLNISNGATFAAATNTVSISGNLTTNASGAYTQTGGNTTLLNGGTQTVSGPITWNALSNIVVGTGSTTTFSNTYTGMAAVNVLGSLNLGTQTLGTVAVTALTTVAANSTSVNGTTATNSFTITGVASTAGIVVGMSVSGTGIPANSYVVSFVANTSVTINQVPTVAGTNSITYASTAPSLLTSNTGGLATAMTMTDASETYAAGTNYTFSGVTTTPFTGTPGSFGNPGNITTAAAVTLNRVVSMSGTLTLGGVLTTSSTNTLSVTNTAVAAITGQSSLNYVSGPLSRTLPASLSSSSNAYIFPIGKGGIYFPVTLNTVTSGASTPVISFEATNTSSGGSAGTGLSAISAAEYWQGTVVSGNFTSGKVSLTRQAALSTLDAIGQNATTLAGAYANLNGTASTPSVNNSDLVTSLGYFVLATKAAAACTAPSTQASSLTFSNIGSGGLDLGWTDGNGAGRVIIMNTSNSFTAPTDGSTPSANLTYGGSGQQVVFNGTASGATPITIGGLSASTTYHFRIYEYCTTDRTYQTATATGNPASQATTAGATTITTTANTYGPYCNSSSNSISIAYSSTGSYTGTFYAQISDASGNFTNTFTGPTIIGSGTSPISATIPSGIAAGTGYKVRVINDTPATYGSDNGTAFTISAPPSNANAGTTVTVCNATTASLNATAPSNGTGAWSVVSGTGSVTTPSLRTSGVTGLTVGASSVFRWTVSTSGCTDFTSDVTVTSSAAATVSVPGTAQSVCGATATLAGNDPSPQTGLWTVNTAATITSPTAFNSGVTGLVVGANVFTWTITNGACTSANSVTITRNNSPSIADAGTTPITVCNATTASLNATAPTNGTGAWTVVSGTGLVTTPSLRTSGVTGLTVGASSVFRWTVSTAGCTDSTSEVTVTSSAAASTANAGSNQSVCDATTATLGATTPTTGTGAWSVVSGGGSVTTASAINSGVTGLGAGANVFRWTVTNGACTSTADVTVTRNITPAITSGTLADVSVNAGSPATFTVTATNAATYTWYVDTGAGFNVIANGTSGGVTYSGATTNSLSATPASTAASGYKYKVTVGGTAPCGSVDSAPSGGATMTVTLAPVALATYTFNGTACAAGTLAASGTFTNHTAANASVTGQTCNVNSATSYSVGGSSWGTAFSSTRYIEVSITPNSTYTLSLTNLAFDRIRTGAGATTLNVRSSLDGYTADLTSNVTVTTSSANTSIALSGFTNISTTGVTFRIYGWGGNSTGDLRLDNIIITGNVIPDVVGTSSITTGTGVTPISSLVDTQAEAGNSFGFTVTDDGATPATDLLATKISGLTITKGVSGDTITDWTQAIAGAELTDGTASLTASSITASTIVFTGISNDISGDLGFVADNGTKNYTLKVWLKSALGGSLPTTIDGNGFVFRVQNTNLLLNGGSGFVTSDVNSGSTNNRVAVVVSQLDFTTQPSTTVALNTNLAQQPVVRARDANGNTDINYTGAVTITTSGSGMTYTTPSPAQFTAGVITFAGLQFSSPGTGVTITVDETPSAGYTAAVSNGITITTQMTLASYGTQPSSSIPFNSSNQVLAGFTVTPNATASFTGVTLTSSGGTADLTNVRIFRDFNGDGIINTIGGTDAQVSVESQSITVSTAFTFSSQTSLVAATTYSYLIVGNTVASPASASVTIGIGSGAFTSNLTTQSGSMTNVVRTLLQPTTTLAAYSTQISGAIAQGTNNAPIAGFTITPNATADFTAVTVTGSGSSTGSINGFRIFRDFNGDGIINTTGGTDAQVSTASLPYATSMAFTLTGQTALVASTTYSYLIVANVTASSGSVGVAISPASNFTTTLAESGTLSTVTRAFSLSNTSNIIRSATFTEPTDIDYRLYQSTDTSTGTTGFITGAVKIAEFTIQDGGDTQSDSDTVQTTLQAITLGLTNSANIRYIALYDDLNTTIITGSVLPGASSVSWSGLSLTANDKDFSGPTAGARTFSVYVSFNTTVIDKQNVGVTITLATAQASRSVFAANNAGGAASIATGASNRLVVTATKLAFGTVSSGFTGTNLSSFTVNTVDVNGSVDKDYNFTISLSTNGTNVSPSLPANYSLVSGTATINGIQFSTAQTGITFSAAGTTGATGVYTNTVDSNTFNINALVNGAWKSVADGLWSTASVWSEYTGGAWSAPGANGVPSNNEASPVYVYHYVTTVGSISPTNIIVEAGGTFELAQTGTYTGIVINATGRAYVTATGTVNLQNVTVNDYGTLETASTAGTVNIQASGTLLVKEYGTFLMSKQVVFASTANFEVRDNGVFIYNSNSTTPSRTTSVWQGVEKFYPNSLFRITNSDTASTYNIIQTEAEIATYTNPVGGYVACFGNIEIDNSGGGALRLMPNATWSTKNLTHGYLKLISNNSTNSLFGGATTTQIGGDLIVDTDYNNNFTLSTTATPINLTVKGNLENKSARTLTLVNGASSTLALTVEGNISASGATGCIINTNGTTGGISTVNLKGDLTIGTNAILFANATTTANNLVNFTGTGDGSTAALTQSINVGSTAATENNNIAFAVENGSYTQLAADLELGNGGTFTVKTGGTVDFGFSGATTTAFNVTERSGGPTGTTVFTSQIGSTLKITSAGGIMAAPAASGNVLLDSRTFAQNGCTFNYVGRANQVTGNIFTVGSTSKTIICDLDTNALTLTLSVPTQTSTLLHIKKGIFVESDTNNLSGGGDLTIDASGTYRSAVVTTTGNFPRMTGTTRTFAVGSTIELNAAASTEQTLRGGLDYKNLIFSNGGTKKLSNATANIDGTVTIKDAAIVNAENNTFGDYDTTILAMTDTSRLILSKSGTVPDMGRFLLTGGTIEFAGNSASHRMRGPIFSSLSPDVNTAYNNVVISGANVNGGSGNYTFKNGATFTVNASAANDPVSGLPIVGPAVFSVTNQELQADTAAAVAVNINGTFATTDIHGFSGNNDSSINPTGMTITLGASSTIEYNGTAAQVLSSRSDYKNLTIDNSLSSGTRGVTANGDVTFSGALALTEGLVNTGSFAIIGTSTASVTRTNGWVNGNLQRYVGSSTSAITYDIGSATVYTPVALTFAAPTGTGSVIVNQTNGAHPNISTATISSTKRVNRYYTLTNVGVGNINYAAVFNFDAADVLDSADTDAFKVGNYNPTTWTYPTVGIKTATSTQATGLTTFGDFLIGECAPPVAYTVTGGGPYCIGSTAPSIGLNNSQLLVNYQLKLDGVDVGSPIAGTGAALNFGVQSTAGVYSIVADNGSCTTTMNSSKTVTVNPLPTATIAIDNTTQCINLAQPTVTFTGVIGTPPFTFTYNRTSVINSVTTTLTNLTSNGTVNVPTGATGTFTYTLVSVQDANSCSQAQSGSVSSSVTLCTSIRDNFCGKTFRFLNEIVQCSPVAGATQYRFEVTDEANVVRVVTSGNFTFNPAAFTFDHPTNRGFNWAKNYSFRVALFIGGNWLAYGPSCTARTPNEPPVLPTKLRSPWFCNQTVASMNTNIQCDPVHLATNYEFRITGPGGYNQARTSTSIAINLTTFPNLRYNTQYTVSVRAFSGGIWIEPIETCTITTPSVPQTSLVAQHCNINTTTRFVVMARTVFYAEAYKFRISDGTTIAEIESPNIYFAASTVTGGMIVTGKVYTVQVDVKYNGVFLNNWGPICQLTIPSSRMSDTNTSSIFNVKAFPNPFATHFSLDIESSSDAQVEMKVYDMIGRQLDVRKATASELSVLEVGRNYPSGVYNVVVSQGDEVKSIRMVKR